MAFNDIKYQSNFYNLQNKLVSVKLYKDDYTGAATDIKVVSVFIDVNYQDDKIPIIGQGAKIVFINQGSFNDFDDLLTMYEKQFKCVIEWNSQVVFEGFSICDLNEQQFLPYAAITVQFTNYLRRLGGDYLTILNTIENRTDLLTIIQDALERTGLEYDLYVNSTLFEVGMNAESTDSFLPQTTVENIVFYENLDEYQNTYDVLNKILFPFGAFIYAYGQRWVIERIENINRIGDWVYYGLLSSDATSTPSLLQTLNKQNGDFEYINTSQNVQYNSGFQTLKLQLQDKAFETLVINNFTTDNIETVADGNPASGELASRTWYINENVTGVITGANYKEIQKYIYGFGGAVAAWANRGIFYVFSMQYISGLAAMEMTLNYKISRGPGDPYQFQQIQARFFIRVNSGDGADQYLKETTDGGLELSVSEYIFTIDFNQGDNSTILSVSKVFPMGDIYVGLGTPKIQDFILGILPVYYTTDGSNWWYVEDIYVGDVEVKAELEAIDNEITVELNENFIKEETISLDLFDLDDIQYVNGFMLTDGTKTTTWDTTGTSTGGYESLVDLFIKDKFRKYSKTNRKLTANILCDNHIKPFAILSDDNLYEDSADDIINFIVTRYSWDLVNGIYHNLEAEEYPDTEILIDES